jgi:hypothetical protein
MGDAVAARPPQAPHSPAAADTNLRSRTRSHEHTEMNARIHATLFRRKLDLRR